MTWLGPYVIPLVAGVIAWSAACAAWFGLAYPAVATDVSASSLSVSLRLSRGQRLPLFLSFLFGAGLWDALRLAMLYLAPEEAADSSLIAFLVSILSFWGSMCFLAVSAAAYRQLQDLSRTAMADAFD